MNKSHNLVARALAVAIFCVAPVPAAAQDTAQIQDATIAAQDAHSVVFENEHVRVISAIASAGHKSPLHSHPPLVVISMDTARVKLTDADGSEVIANVRPGTVFWGDGGVHQWELLAGEINIIAVEVKSAADAVTAASEVTTDAPEAESADASLDSTIAAPGAHSVVMENEHVRVISAIASAGHQSPRHSHPPLVVISLATARSQVTNADGSEAIVNFRPGTVFWLDETVHEWELLAGEIDAIAVEVKSAAKSDTAEAESAE